LKLYYNDAPTPNFSETPTFRVPSKWIPPVSDVQLEIYLSELEEKIMEINETGKNFPNLSLDERISLKHLADNRDLVIKPADKGSAIVVWGRKDYVKEADKQLSDEAVYEKCASNPLTNVNNEIKEVLNDMQNKKEIDKKTKNYLLVNKPQLGRFYLLPKIHKRTKNVPGRPVISNNGTATENISAFLDFHLKSIVPEVTHILEDTRDFLSRINQLRTIPEGSILVLFDV